MRTTAHPSKQLQCISFRVCQVNPTARVQPPLAKVVWQFTEGTLLEALSRNQTMREPQASAMDRLQKGKSTRRMVSENTRPLLASRQGAVGCGMPSGHEQSGFLHLSVKSTEQCKISCHDNQYNWAAAQVPGRDAVCQRADCILLRLTGRSTPRFAPHPSCASVKSW